MWHLHPLCFTTNHDSHDCRVPATFCSACCFSRALNKNRFIVSPNPPIHFAISVVYSFFKCCFCCFCLLLFLFLFLRIWFSLLKASLFRFESAHLDSNQLIFHSFFSKWYCFFFIEFVFFCGCVVGLIWWLVPAVLVVLCVTELHLHVFFLFTISTLFLHSV